MQTLGPAASHCPRLAPPSAHSAHSGPPRIVVRHGHAASPTWPAGLRHRMSRCQGSLGSTCGTTCGGHTYIQRRVPGQFRHRVHGWRHAAALANGASSAGPRACPPPPSPEHPRAAPEKRLCCGGVSHDEACELVASRQLIGLPRPHAGDGTLEEGCWWRGAGQGRNAVFCDMSSEMRQVSVD